MTAQAPVAPPPPRVAAPETAGPHDSSPKPLADHDPPPVGQAAPPGLLETAYAVLDDYLEEGRVYAEARRARGAAALDAARRGGPAAPAPPGAPDVVELIRRAAVEGLGALAPALGQIARTSADLMPPPREVPVRPVARGDDIWSRPNTISSPGSSPGAPPRSSPALQPRPSEPGADEGQDRSTGRYTYAPRERQEPSMRPTRGSGAPLPDIKNDAGLDLAEVLRPPADWMPTDMHVTEPKLPKVLGEIPQWGRLPLAPDSGKQRKP